MIDLDKVKADLLASKPDVIEMYHHNLWVIGSDQGTYSEKVHAWEQAQKRLPTYVQGLVEEVDRLTERLESAKENVFNLECPKSGNDVPVPYDYKAGYEMARKDAVEALSGPGRKRRWRPGDACGTCGSHSTVLVDGVAHCNYCGSYDDDE